MNKMSQFLRFSNSTYLLIESNFMFKFICFINWIELSEVKFLCEQVIYTSIHIYYQEDNQLNKILSN